MTLLDALMAQIAYVQNRSTELVDPQAAMQQAMIAVIGQLVVEVQALQPTVVAATEQAQPAVAEENNTGSGAAPVDPVAAPATDSAVTTSAAAGAAPEQQPQG